MTPWFAISSPRRRRQRAVVVAWLSCLSCVGCLSCFLAGAVPRSPPGRCSDRGLKAFPWEAQANPKADEAYEALCKSFPDAAKSGTYMGTSCSKDIVRGRFDGLCQLFGQGVALTVVEKEPFLLLGDTQSQKSSFEYLKSLETDSQKGLALDTVIKNPRLLTVPVFEYQRTKPSLDSLAATSGAIDFIRPLGELGLAAAIFGSFVVIILVLRPIFYGVGGGQSLVGALTSWLPPIPRPADIAASYGINLASLVALIPLYQVFSAVKNSSQYDKLVNK
eukprot:TRINITY_DN104176_c0_g1_i1.p1 TRINITY_DN104176_c0_g1~~TRINITY_DN104176_c0_g1_i1.p1  ORF type:complete len:277 (+),score=37.30 TRINITY_DN104176_c0_g1_i1:31-861(+)